MLPSLSSFQETGLDIRPGKKSIDLREEIVLPLLTIQQYGLMKIQELLKAGDLDEESRLVYEKLVTRSLFGNINASRNSA